MHSIDLEYVNCNICNEDTTELLFKVKDRLLEVPGEFNLVKCLNCGLIYLNPRPSKENISKYYTNEYEPHFKKDVLRNLALNIYSKIFNYPILELECLNPNRVLDVGCGSGGFLERLHKKGWEAYGIDVSSKAVRNARKKGLNVLEGELHEANFKPKFFDIVVMRHSLEHMHDPCREIESAHRVLKERGILLVEVPNINCFEARLFREYWFAIDAPRHLYHFSEKTITRLLHKAGFNITSIVHLAVPFATIQRSIRYRFKLELFHNPLTNVLFYPFSILETKLLHQGPSIVVKAIRED